MRNLPLYSAAILYAAASLVIVLALVRRSDRIQKLTVALVLVGLALHTFWIGTICAATGHPPLTNLPETAAFIAWVIVAVELFIFFRYKVDAAGFFVYPLVVLLLTVTIIVQEPFAKLDVARSSKLFISHLLFSTLGIAGLLIALTFMALYQIQNRAIKSKHRGAFYEWIPSLRVCDLVSYRALTVGFLVYTGGLILGVVWGYQSKTGGSMIGAKEIGAVVAWLMFAALLQSYVSGSFRTPKTVVISAVAFISIVVAILGIQHV